MKLLDRLFVFILLIVLPLAGCSHPAPSASSTASLNDRKIVSQATPIHQAGNPVQIISQFMRDISPMAGSQNSALASIEAAFEAIYKQDMPSVVNIQVVDNNGSGLGSGFVWDQNGDIVTNNHVIAGSRKITVIFYDGSMYPGRVAGADPDADLAVIKVDAPARLLQPLQMADSNRVQVGQIAIAIGNPFGLSGTMTSGIVSGLNRALPVTLRSSQQNLYAIPDIIQTDASINPGNSGGVLVDDKGQVIGVTTAIESPVDVNAGVGFAIPSSIVKKVIPALIQNGHYDHPWLGISGFMLTPDVAQYMKLPSGTNGVLVWDVLPNSPAQKAGLKGSTRYAVIDQQPTRVGGDVITAINGQPVISFEDLLAYLFDNTQVGQTVELSVIHNGQMAKVQVTLVAAPQTK